jgi:hypothetical protein
MRAHPQARNIGYGLAWLLLARSAAAQVEPSIDARPSKPSTDPEAGLVLEPTSTTGAWHLNVGFWTQYAQDPIALRFVQTGRQAIVPVAHQVTSDVVVGIGLWDRAAIGVDMPFFLTQNGSAVAQDTVVTGGTVPPTGLGDLAISGKVTLASNDRSGVRSGFGVAALGSVSLPTGSRQSFLGEGAVTASLRILAEMALGIGSIRASVGYDMRTETRTWPASYLGGVMFGDDVPWAFAVDIRPKALVPAADNGDRQAWEIGVHGLLPAGPVWPTEKGAASLSPALVGLDDRIAIGKYKDAYVLVGGEIGLDSAVGVPEVSGDLSIGWAPRSHDRDHDGIPDDVDECPDLPEDIDGVQDQDGCPENDSDSGTTR